jgi:hypothetical protein
MLTSNANFLIDIGQHYTKAGHRAEAVPMRVFKTHHHIIFEPMPEEARYEGFKCGKSKVLANLNDNDAYNAIHDYLEYLFYE